MKRHHLKKFSTILVCCIFATDSAATTYTVQRGDSLSKIAGKCLKGRIYGAKGNLKQLLEKNSQIVNSDHIRVGDLIQLPTDCLKNSDYKVAQLASSHEEDSINSKARRDEERTYQYSTSSFKPYSSLGLNLVLGFSRLESTQVGGASAISKLANGGNLDWTQHWSETLESQVYFDIMNYKFESSADSSFSKNSSSISEFGLGITKNISKRFKLQVLLGYRSSPYLRAAARNALVIEDVQATVVKAVPKFDLIRLEDLSLELNAPLEYEFSGKGSFIKTDGGLGYGLGLQIRHQTSWGEINSGGFYRRLSSGFGTTISNTQEIRSYIGFRYNIGTGKND